MIKRKCLRYTLVSVFLVALYLACAIPGSAAMVMTPYLQAVTTNSVYVLVECDSTSTVTVDYGLTTSYGSAATTESYNSTTGSTYIHNIKLTGLSANTTYHSRASW